MNNATTKSWDEEEWAIVASRGRIIIIIIIGLWRVKV